jgi:hypothetical protein
VIEKENEVEEYYTKIILKQVPFLLSSFAFFDCLEAVSKTKQPMEIWLLADPPQIVFSLSVIGTKSDLMVLISTQRL